MKQGQVKVAALLLGTVGLGGAARADEVDDYTKKLMTSTSGFT